MPLARLRHIRDRRRALRAQIDAVGDFERWEETCVPSYLHPNWAAAGVAWWRLFAAVTLAERHAPAGSVLDFGASVGEVGQLLGPNQRPYAFVEMEEPAAERLKAALPDAVRHTLDEAPDGHFKAVFALDSLEHNTNYAELLAVLRDKLAPDGVLILSGPTENALYKLGRRIAGFDAHYHETNIHAIERAAAPLMTRVAVKTVPVGVPLFRLSVWKRRDA